MKISYPLFLERSIVTIQMVPIGPNDVKYIDDVNDRSRYQGAIKTILVDFGNYFR